MPLDLAQLRDFATRYTAAWCSQNPEAVAAFFSPNGSLKINHAAPSVGRSALTEAARGFMNAFPGLKASMNDLIPGRATERRGLGLIARSRNSMG